jgi:undecaprenyl-diphosphatase
METITWWQAIILGLVQGLTEFIPVSSSAHLNLTHWLFGHERELAYDVFLHIGTLFALVFYFRHDWIGLIRNPAQARLRNLIFLSCVPAVIAGVLLRDAEENSPIFKDPRFNATMLLAMGLVLWAADRIGRKTREIESANTTDALLIGLSQALALIPGVSRSGSTLTMGLLRSFTRGEAARFSFLMSLPITLGAVLFEVYGQVKHGELFQEGATMLEVVLGILASGASGFWAIGFLLNYLKTRDVSLFVFWRAGVAVMVFVAIALNWVTVPGTKPRTSNDSLRQPTTQGLRATSTESASSRFLDQRRD